jgi:murein DD-endopeptidase MepM/ murein hydrolase activator NlpD
LFCFNFNMNGLQRHGPHQKWGRLLAVGLWGALTLFPLWPSGRLALPEAQAVNRVQLKEKQKTINTQRQTIHEKRIEKLRHVRYHRDRMISKQIELSKTQRELDSQQVRLHQTSHAIQGLQKNLDVTVGKTTRLGKIMGTRIRHWFKGGRISLIQQILASTSVSEMVDSLYFQERILRQDTRIFEALKHEGESLKTQQAHLLENLRQNAMAYSEIKRLKINLYAQKVEEERMRQRYASDAKYYEMKERQLLAESSKIEELLRGHTNGLQKSTGRFMWPLMGRLTSGFGYRIHPIHHTRLNHTGIDISRPTGTPIMASDGGRVMFAGWYGGYGKCIIINHGRGFATLYGHLSRVGVSRGSAVAKGQSIGAVGSTGYSTGSHLHFEVRVNGRPVNPKRYL